MALIEGIGDEVLQTFLYIFLFLIGVVAWWSTRVTERQLVRTVLILERRSNRQVAGEPPPEPTEPVPPPEDKPMETSSVDQAEAGSAPLATPAESPDVPTETAASSLESHASRAEDDLRNRRLAYYSEAGTLPGISQGSVGRSVSYCSPQTESFQTDTAKPEVETVDSHKPSISVNESEESSKETLKSLDDEPHNIRIRLKYLNDDLKMVDGNLEEQLGDFKRRHFSLEMSGRKLVRLIFNGQVLGQDTWTLGHYGLFDNCVVHCLVHSPRTPPPSPNLSAREGSPRHRHISAWAVSNVLLAGLSVLLGLAWYGRYHYAHLYTATTTVALVGLTGLFTVSLIGIYMPEFMQN